MASSRDAGYLTSGQVARLLGVSKGTVLRAAAAGTLHAAYTMPGGTLHFMPAEVERYGAWRRRTRRLQTSLASTASLVPILREEKPDAATETADSPPSLPSSGELLSSHIDSTPGDLSEETTTLLALVAESLQVGAACLARFDGGTWLITQVHDRAGMGLRVGTLLPYSPVYGQDLARGGMPALIVEDLRADGRFAGDAATANRQVGALTAIPLVWADGQAPVALCTLHPHARSVSSGEVSLLRLAGRMLVQAAQAAAALAREQQAARQAAVFAAMVEHSDDAIVGMSLAGQIETWNSGARRLYGYTGAEAIGQHSSLLAPLNRADKLPGLLTRIARGERVDHFETVRVRKDGSRVDVAVTISPILNGAGEIISASTIARDITVLTRTRAAQEQTRVLAEELAHVRSAAEEAQRFQATLLNAVGQAVVATDLQGTITYWNRAAEVLYGWPAAEVLNRNAGEVLITRASRDEGARIMDALRRGETWSGEFQVQRRDGSVFPAMVTDSPVVDAEGRLIGIIGVSTDISVRKQEEEARAASEERFRGVFEHAPIGLTRVDTQGRILEANRAMQRMLGYDEDELRRLTPAQLAHPADFAANWALAEEVLAGTRDAFTLDKRYLRKDGSIVWGQLAVCVTRDQRGAPRSIIGMVLDVTERHGAEERLRQSEAQYRRLVELAQEGIWQLDAEQRTVYVNQKLADLLGYGTAEMLGTPLCDFLDEEGQSARAVQAPCPWQDAPADVDWKLRGKDGSAVWVHITASAFRDEHGAYAGGMAMITDIRRRKADERALQEAWSAADALAGLRAEQVEEAEAMSAVSSALAETLEPSQLYALILEQVVRLMHCDHTCVLLYQDGWATVAASRGAVVQPDGLRIFPVAAIDPVMAFGMNGQPALICDTAAIHWIDVPPLVGEFAIRSSILVPLVLDGMVVGTFNVDSFTPHSYTEQHLARAVALGHRVTQALRNVRLFQLEQDRARNAEELVRLKDDFVASVSHELRTPLTAILGYAELLEARWPQLDDARRLDQVRKIVHAAHRQQRVVEDLLVLSSLEHRTLAPTPIPVLIGDLVRQAREEIQATYRDQRIECDECRAVQVLANPDRTLRVLVNLLDNAAKYSPVGSPITVTCAVEEGMGVVRIRDYGSGVPAHGRERLFTRFGRVAGSRTRAGRVGTGLGLYLSRRLVEEMDGDLDLEATGPTGSTFRLRLPALAAQRGEKAACR